MNVLLVMPKTGYLWDEWATPPIGIAYVSSYLKENRYTYHHYIPLALGWFFFFLFAFFIIIIALEK